MPIDRDGSACPRSRPIVATHPPPGSSMAVTAPPPSRGWPPAHWPASIISFNASDCSMVRPSPGFRPAAASLVGARSSTSPGRSWRSTARRRSASVSTRAASASPRRFSASFNAGRQLTGCSERHPIRSWTAEGYASPPRAGTGDSPGTHPCGTRLCVQVAVVLSHRETPGCMATHRPRAAVGAVRTEAVPTASTARSGPRRVCLTAGFGGFRLPELCQPRAGPKGGARAGNRSDRRDPVGHGPQGAP